MSNALVPVKPHSKKIAISTAERFQFMSEEAKLAYTGIQSVAVLAKFAENCKEMAPSGSKYYEKLLEDYALHVHHMLGGR